MSNILESIDDDLEDFDEYDDSSDADFELVSLSDDDYDDDFQLSENKAREVTDAIKSAATATYVLLARAHQGKAFKALGYGTWAEYINSEFDMSVSRSYQFLDLFKVVESIEAVSPEGTKVKLTEAQARDIKREIPFITEQIREDTEGLEPDEAASRIDEIVAEARENKRLEEEAVAIKEKGVQEAHEEGVRAGLEMAADSFLEQNGGLQDGPEEDGGLIEVEVAGDSGGLSPQAAMDLHNFFNVLAGTTALPEPDDIILLIPENRRQEIDNQIEQTQAWFNRFSTLWEAQD